MSMVGSLQGVSVEGDHFPRAESPQVIVRRVDGEGTSHL
jgi:hypothetical protein